MEEPKKKRIVIASVLKPVDDTRMFEKIAQTIAETGLYDVHAIGYPTKSSGSFSTPVTFHTSQAFKRISFGRLIRPFQIFQNVYAIDPALMIITTHELLLVALLLKLLRKNVRIVYDVQENYFLNILHTTAFPQWLRRIVAGYVRFKEKLLSPSVDLFFLAEKTYADELSFTSGKNIILENKLKKSKTIAAKESKTNSNITLLFSGTLAQTTGILEAIHVACLLHAIEPSIRLKIVGYCAQPYFLEEIKSKINDCDFINLIGGDTLVPHNVILQEIQRADLGIIAYTPNVATSNRMPTKLYEYLGYRLPILLTDHPPWMEYCARFNAHVPIGFENPDVLSILHALKNTSFYPSPPEDILWETEEPKLLAALKTLI